MEEFRVLNSSTGQRPSNERLTIIPTSGTGQCSKCDIGTFYFDRLPVIAYAGGYDKIKHGSARGEAFAQEINARGSSTGRSYLLTWVASRVSARLQSVYGDFATERNG
ncbi:MAG: hypothetical protein CMN04_01470 [Roseibacillus sp.]|nr:hypothetical protein [Roseibacillus sp.]